ncbi:MAG: Holliday junction branch migration protein RuvA [Deltaproteobacteria bacterium]|nr:Holliday junction branch migration protein RuvA [Deltaproteobacteria bacterium]
MIAFLEGRLLSKSPEYIIVSAQGIGYQVAVPLSSFYDLPALEQGVRLHIYTHVRQDAIQLFGFLTPNEKEIFLLLLGVSGIGPKVALNILSGISSQELSQALMAEDSARIQRIPGIGKKTAERIVLELKDKIKKLSSGSLPDLVRQVKEGTPWEDALSALVNLGYPKAIAEKALGLIKNDTEDTISLEDLLRKALKSLSR